MGLIRQCLSNFPKRRPEASEILRQIIDIMSRASLTHQSKMEMQTQIDSLEDQLSTENQEKQSLIAQNQSLIAQKRSEVDALRAEIEKMSVQSPQKYKASGFSSPLTLQPQPPTLPHSSMDFQVKHL